MHYFQLIGQKHQRGKKQAALLIVCCLFFFFSLMTFLHPLNKVPTASRVLESCDSGDQNNLTPLSNFPLAAQNGCPVNDRVMRSNRAGAENETLRAHCGSFRLLFWLFFSFLHWELRQREGENGGKDWRGERLLAKCTRRSALEGRTILHAD